MKTIAVSIARAEEVNGKWYWGSDHLVPLDVAEELVKRKAAKIIDPDYKASPDDKSGSVPPVK